MLQEQSQKRLKPILRFIEEDAPFSVRILIV